MCFQLKHRYVASLILHARIVEITAQLSFKFLCVAYLILLDHGTIKMYKEIRIFVQINILERRAGYVVLMGRLSVTIFIFIPLSGSRNRKIYQ